MRVRSLVVAGAALLLSAGLLAQGPLRSGIDPSALDRMVRPQDDFYRHVNGGWLARTEIPPDRPVYGTFVQLADKAEADLRAIVEAQASVAARTPGTPAQQIGDLYASFMDEPALNRLGGEPLKARLAEVDAVRNGTDLAALLGRLAMAGLPGAVGNYVEPDAGDPTAYALYLSQAGTALPDRDYYLKDDPRLVEIRGKYQQYLERIFTLAGRPAGAEDARTVLALETALAKVQWSQTEDRDAVKTYNKMAVATIVAEMPGFDWMAWARPQRIDTLPSWVIREPSFFKAFASLVPGMPLGTWKAWLAAQVITANARYLSQPFVDAHFEFFGRALNGQQAQRDRWKRGVQLVNGNVGEALGQLYVAQHFSPAAKTRVQQLIASLLEAYRRSITTLDWMTPETRQAALAKLAKFSTKIAYPDRWRDYSRLRITSADLVGNVERAQVYESEYQLAKLGRPVDRNDWLMTPQTVNAYYNPSQNEIVFPAAILQPPFFDAGADDAVNYGAIGAVIGHEIGHGFDDQGRRYDGDGLLRDWWTADDEREFTRRTKLLVDQFGAYSPLQGVTVNGELTLGENIGDLGGLSIAYQAWKIVLGGRTAPDIDGLTGDQRFFMGWAQAWRGKAREAYLQRQVLSDPHAWNEFRVNGIVANVDGFYTAFGVKPGDKLYRDPAIRVRIW
ncbi:MAG: M13-type metalloendopeptidase [Vicinamibacterales bacterium]